MNPIRTVHACVANASLFDPGPTYADLGFAILCGVALALVLGHVVRWARETWDGRPD